MRMHRLLVGLVLALMVAFTASAQTLADRARELRKEKRTPSANQRVFTNESLNLRPAPSIAETPATVKKPGEAAAASESDEEGDGEQEKAPSPEEEKAKLAADFKDKIEKAKAELTQLQREADVAEREGRLKAAVFYADAGTRLRDERKYAEDDRKAKADLADKQRKITELQANIERLRDGARRAGLPPGMIP